MTKRYPRLLGEERGLWLTGFAGLTAAVVYACSGSDADPGAAESSTGAAMSGSSGASGALGTAGSGGQASVAPPASVAATSGIGSAAGSGGAPPAASSTTSAVIDAGVAPPADTAKPAADAGSPPQSQHSDAAMPADSGAATHTAPNACDSDPSTASHTSAVVDAAKALLAALTPDQQRAIAYDKTLANAQTWSNLPTSFVPRNGVEIGDLSSDAQKAAVALVDAAAGGIGASLFSEVREADEWLVTDGRAGATDYGRGLYYFAIHGTPSTSTAWMLQVAGHHLAYNFTYAGTCTSATPLFDGVEPMTWTGADGKKHAPLETQRSGMVLLLASVASKPEAKLAGTFADLIAGPVGGGPPGLGFPGTGGMSAGGDTNYPSGIDYPTGSSGRGVLVSTLTDDQKALVKAAIEAWVKNVADPVSSALLASYESEEAFKQTYVGYSGSPDLTTQASYARIDGPRVWIEFTVQGGIIYRDKVHYHTIWRDKAADYGAEYATQ